MSRSRSSVLVVLALLLGALLIAPSAQARPQAVTRTLTITATPNAALAGVKVKLSGKLSSSPKNSNVRIQFKQPKKWVLVKNVHTTNAAGAWSAVVTLPKTAGAYRYRAFAPGFEGLKPATSAAITVTALRKTTFFKPDGKNDVIYLAAPQGASSKATGALNKPFTAGASAVLQRKVSGKWTKVGGSTVQSSGQFQIPFVAETGVYRVVIGRKGLNAAATSVAKTLTFEKA